jgi:enhancer of polycomb-like protein
MTRYGGLGRTRPKKLTAKASIPIVREDEIDVIDDELQSTLQQIETGVEKAEESVSVLPTLPVPNFSLASSLHIIT